MKRPNIKTPCVADRYHAPNERIAEVLFPSGKGCLIRLTETESGARIHVYRADSGIEVAGFDSNGNAITRGVTS